MDKARPDDRTARARIRDAVVLCFARDGFSTPLRVIAQEAGVSVPLITHHYHTKDALREVCDEWILERFLELKLMAIHQPDSVKNTLSDSRSASILTVYMVRSFLDATNSVRPFFDKYLEQVRRVVDTASQAGMVTPSSDEEERLRIIATQNLGSLLVEFVLNPPADPATFVDQVYTSRNLAAFLELYSQPFFNPSPAMETYMESVKEKRTFS